MSKRRMIDSICRESDSYASLNYRQRDLWIGLICTADDQGRHKGSPALIRSKVWPCDDITLDEVKKDIDALINVDYIILYENDGSQYIQIINWWKYQQMQWAGPSDYPAPDGWIDRMRYHSKGRQIVQENWDSKGGYNTQCDKGSYQGSDKGSYQGSETDNEQGLTQEEVKRKLKPEIKDKRESEDNEQEQFDPLTIYINITNTDPIDSTHDQIRDILGDQPDHDKLKQVFKMWCLKGYNPMNVEGILEWYVEGIPDNKKTDKKSYTGGKYAEFINH